MTLFTALEVLPPLGWFLKKGLWVEVGFVVLEELDTVELQQNDKEKLVILFVVASLVDSVVSLVCFDSKKATSVICMGFLLDDNSRFQTCWELQEVCKFTDFHLESSSHRTASSVWMTNHQLAYLTSVSCANFLLIFKPPFNSKLQHSPQIWM